MGESLTIERLQALDRKEFEDIVDEVLEGPPVFAGEAWRRGPFDSLGHLHNALCRTVREADEERKLDLIRAHPELAGEVATTDHSTAEQSGAGLDRLSPEEHKQLSRMNRAYRERFGFPFVICVRNHTRESILENLEKRLGNSLEEEKETAIGEICEISRLRLEIIFREPG